MFLPPFYLVLQAFTNSKNCLILGANYIDVISLKVLILQSFENLNDHHRDTIICIN